MLFGESRTPARTIDGESVLLADQDRSKWNQTLIAEGREIVRACRRLNRTGPYQIQADIQAVHCEAQSVEETDWHRIETLYHQLYAMMPTPVVALNRAIAIGETMGFGAALAEFEGLTEELADYYLLHATQGVMLQRLGRDDEARSALERAAGLANGPGRKVASQPDRESRLAQSLAIPVPPPTPGSRIIRARGRKVEPANKLDACGE